MIIIPISLVSMALQLEQISVRYRSPSVEGGWRTAVGQVSLALGAGEIGVLVGPSGCGKTSLLRAVAGLEPLAGGRIVMDGRVLADAAQGQQVPAEQRRIGMVFQDYALFP